MDCYFAQGSSWGSYELVYYKVKYDVPDYNYLFTAQDFTTVFPIGNTTQFSVYNETTNRGSDGWEVRFLDKNDVYWSSSRNSAQAGSFVKVDSKTDATGVTKKCSKLVGTLSCIVYDENGNSKLFKGTFSQLFSGEETNN